MNIDVKRLETDLDYWNEVAPIGTEAAFISEDKFIDWYKISVDKYYDKQLGWTKAAYLSERKTKLLLRANISKWTGPKDGLPPIGSKVEYDDCDNGWVPTIILAHHPDGSCAWHESVKADGFSEGRNYSTDSARSFRPLKTEKERVIEWALFQDCEPHEGTMSRKEFCEALYDAGALKMPGGE